MLYVSIRTLVQKGKAGVEGKVYRGEALGIRLEAFLRGTRYDPSTRNKEQGTRNKEQGTTYAILATEN